MVVPLRSLEGDPRKITIQYWMKEMLGDRKCSAKHNVFCFREEGKLPKRSSISSWASDSLTQEPTVC